MNSFNTNTELRGPGAGRPTYLFSNWRGHGHQVAHLARDMALELGLSDGSAARVERAARYHDIGKSKLPNLFEESEGQPEELSRSERELLMSHTWLGYRILQGGPDPDSWVADAALLHHEWWNGTGYPLGLAQSDIPLVARIVAVADAYSALLEQLPYAGPRQLENALAGIRHRAGTELDPDCVEALAAVEARSEAFAAHPDTMAGVSTY